MFKSLKEKFSKKGNEDIFVLSPLEGEAVPMNTVNDPTFAGEMLGKGIAIKPSVGRVIAPIDGEISILFETKHALSIVGENGVELLIHIGLDTVNLKGEYFVAHAKTGDKVKAGDLLLEFDMKKIREAGYDIITPVIVCNTLEFADVKESVLGQVKELDKIIEVVKK